MFKLSLNILLLNILAYIKASAAGSCVTLPADIMTGFFLLLIFVQTFLSADGQIAILQGSLNLIFGKSWKINYQLITCLLYTSDAADD